MDVGRGVKPSCSKCGGPLASETTACKRCGAISGEQQQYGLLELDGGDAAAGSGLALDSIQPAPRRTAPRGDKARAARAQSSQRLNAVNPAARAGARTVAEGGTPRSATSGSSARNRAVTDATVQQQRKATVAGNPTAPNAAAARPAKKSADKMRAASIEDGLPDLVDDPALHAVPY